VATSTECPQGNQTPVFDIEKCQVPCIFPIPDGTWGNFWLPQRPEFIYDFEDPVQIPLAPDIPCPVFTVGSQASTVKRAVSFICPGGAQGNLEVKLTKKDCCAFDLDFELEIPCPVITGSPVTISTPSSYPGTSTLTITSCTGGGDQGCDFDLGLEINFPCPSISGSGAGTTEIVTVGGESATLNVTKTEECNLDFELDIKFPCPQMQGIQTKSIVLIGEESVDLDITMREGEDCDFIFALDIKFPCPQMVVEPGDGGPTGTDWPMVPVEDRKALLKVEKGIEDTDCDFTFSLDIKFPCPTVAGSPFTATTSVVNVGSESATLAVVPDEDCDFIFTLDIAFPCPAIYTSAGAGGPTGTDWPMVPVEDRKALLTVTKGDYYTACDFTFSLDIKFPCPNIETTAAGYNSQWTNAPTGKAVIQVREGSGGDDCAFDLDYEILFPCPKFDLAKVEVLPAYEADNPFEPADPTAYIEFERTSTPTDCKYGFTFYIRFPEGGPTGPTGPTGGVAGATGVTVMEKITSVTMTTSGTTLTLAINYDTLNLTVLGSEAGTAGTATGTYEGTDC